MARPAPYVHRQQGDLIQAEEWNEIQIRSREAVEEAIKSHNHSGGERGVQISSDGIAAGSITSSHLAAELTIFNTVRVVVGKVKENGEKIWGDGFASKRTERGQYEIRFDAEFSEAPVVIACCTDTNINQKETVGCANVSTSGFDVRIWRNTDNELDDDPFDFIALGPR